MGSESHPRTWDAAAAIQLPGIDMVDVMQRLEGNFPLLARLLPQFVETSVHRCALLKQACQSRDADQISLLLHQLRGAAGSIGATRILALVRHVEEDLAQDGTATLKPFLVALDVAVAEVGRAADLASDGVDASVPRLDRPPATSQFVLLLDLLADNNMRALDVIGDCEAYLAAALSREEVGSVVSAVENLDFARALILLTDILPAGAK